MASSRQKMALRSKMRVSTMLETLESRLLLTAITTYHVDNLSSGVNSNEIVLTPADVNASQFGKKFSTTVTGQVYAEPLYVPGVNITSGSLQGMHNVVYVVTQHDQLYAIDANGGAILWNTNFLDTANAAVNLMGATAITSVPNSAVGSSDISPEIGITATPVIDPNTGFLYLVAKTQETIGGNANNYVQTVYKVNIQSGVVAAGTVIGDTISSGGYTYVTTGAAANTPYVFGTGDGAVTVNGKSVVYFNGLRELGRPGLTLVNGVVYMGFASHGDNGPYHGWMLGYDENTLALKGVLNTTPNGSDGGIWQGAGKIDYDPETQAFFFETGNGSFGEGAGNFGANFSGLPHDADYGDSFVKVQLDSTTSATSQNANGWGLKITDFFSPFDNAHSGDEDLGSGGPTILPDAVGSAAHPHLLIGGGKGGVLYLVDRDNMGGFSPTTDRMVQEIAGAFNSLFNEAAFFLNNPSPASGSPSGTALIVTNGGPVKAFNISNGVITTTPTSTSAISFGGLGGGPTVSANGTANAIMWAINRGDNNLYAYDANNLGTLLWSSAQGTNNGLGSNSKFTVPTVADGEVFVGTANALVGYGLTSVITSGPAAPTNLAATAPAFNSVVLTWQDNSNNEDSFLVERTTTPNNASSWVQIGTVGANVTTYTDNTAVANTTYSYRVRAHNTFNGNSYSSYSNTFAVTTPQAPPQGTGDGAYAQFWNLPSGDNVPTLPISSATYGTPVLTRVDPTIDFNWGTNSPGTGVNNTYFAALWTGRFQAQFSQTYTFYSTANDGAVLMISPAGANTWATVLSHWTNGGLATATGTYAMSAGAMYDFQYEMYQATATSQAHLSWSSPSTPMQIIPQLQMYSGSAPAAPTNLTATPQASYQVNLAWTNNSNIATGIEVQRMAPGGSFTTITTLPPGSNTYIDADLLINTQYSYRVRADNFAADSAFSNVATITTPTPPAAPTNAHVTAVTSSPISVAMAWTDNANDETGFHVQRAAFFPGQQSFNFSYIAYLPANSVPAPSTVTYTDTGSSIPLVAGTEYEYLIDAYNLGGALGNSGFTTDTITNAPTSLQAAGGNSQVVLNWTAPSFTSDTPSDLTFNVYRTTNSNGTGATKIANSLSSPTCTDHTAVNGTTYYYTVTASDLGGESAVSNLANATPQGTLSATQVAFSTAAQTLTAGVASGTITVQLKDQNGNPINATSSTVVNLASTSGAGTFLPTSLTIAAGSGSASFTYKDTIAGTPTLTASSVGLTSATQQETVNAAVASQIVFTTAAQTLTAGVASGSITVELKDTFGNVAKAGAGGQVINLGTSSGTGTLSAPTITVAAGSSTASFTYKDTTTGTPTLTASATGLTSATQIETVIAAAASQIVFITAAQTLTAGVASGTITIELKDTFGNVAKAGFSGQAITLGSTAGTGAFTPASVTVASGNSTVSFTYKDTAAGTPTITASATGLVSATQQETVNPASMSTATQIVFPAATNGVLSNNLPKGTLSPPYTVQLRDASNNPVVAPAGGIVVTLTSSSSSGRFTDGNGNTITSVTVAAGTSTASFLYTDTALTVITLTASRTGLSSAVAKVTISAVKNTQQITFTSSSVTLSSGVVSTTITIQLSDINGGTASVANKVINLASTYGTGIFLNGATHITSVTTNASGIATFTYEDTAPAGATPILSASLSGNNLVVGSQQETIV